MKYDIIIIGGGIVGLATGLKILSKSQSLKVLLLDKENTISAHQTGNNSGVIHSGIYYKPGSLKAKNCIDGYHQLLDFCNKNDVHYELCGKVIVATTPAEIPLLNNLYERGMQNGLGGLKLLEQEEILACEPHTTGIKGIFVPQTGIVDFKQVSARYASLIQNLGGEIQLNTAVSDIKKINNGSSVITNQGFFDTKLVVNCAGLYSDKIAKLTDPDVKVKIIPFRGEYYKIADRCSHLVKNLIYPVPDPNFPFLGVHFTRMIEGGIEAGPNAVLAFAREGYKMSDINLPELAETLTWPGFLKVASKYWKTGFGEFYRSFSKSAFTHALQKLIPEIRENDLVPGGAGVRAQACDITGNLLDDFLILENQQAVNVCNAPSPAATSSLAIGDTVSDIILKRFE